MSSGIPGAAPGRIPALPRHLPARCAWILLAAGCSEQVPAPVVPRFTDVTAASGVDFTALPRPDLLGYGQGAPGAAPRAPAGAGTSTGPAGPASSRRRAPRSYGSPPTRPPASRPPTGSGGTTGTGPSPMWPRPSAWPTRSPAGRGPGSTSTG